MRIALVTYAAAPDLTDDDQLLRAALHARGVSVAAVRWDDPAADWSRFQHVVLRSPWDYVERATEFRAWIQRMQRDGVPLRNSAPIVIWNMDKQYLAGLAAQGIPVVPTIWLKQGARAELASLLSARRWERAVVKPTISASGVNTWATTGERAPRDQAALDALLSAGDVMVQPFMPQVGKEGEWSLLFFDRQYSHAVLKRAAKGEFRVQSDYGGSKQAAIPSTALIAQAHAVLRAVPGPLLYARVDGVVVNGQFVLMELELIEPSLFLGSAPGAADRLAEAVIRCR
jgi:hypothetical protein